MSCAPLASASLAQALAGYNWDFVRTMMHGRIGHGGRALKVGKYGSLHIALSVCSSLSRLGESSFGGCKLFARHAQLDAQHRGRILDGGVGAQQLKFALLQRDARAVFVFAEVFEQRFDLPLLVGDGLSLPSARHVERLDPLVLVDDERENVFKFHLLQPTTLSLSSTCAGTRTSARYFFI